MKKTANAAKLFEKFYLIPLIVSLCCAGFSFIIYKNHFFLNLIKICFASYAIYFALFWYLMSTKCEELKRKQQILELRKIKIDLVENKKRFTKDLIENEKDINIHERNIKHINYAVKILLIPTTILYIISLIIGN